MDIYTWLGIIALLILIGIALEREIYFYEGVHLGPRVQSWLYDRWARKYDEGKRASQLDDNERLARPLLEALKNIPEPFILDFGAGTGRLSVSLLNQPDFNGRIIALDLSRGMLEKAASKLSGLDTWRQGATTRPAEIVELLCHKSMPLPFPDAAFDAVCALEVLELFADMQEPLAELTRVLRPGGILLTSRGTEESGRSTKIKSKLEFGLLLTQNDIETFSILPWWKLFDRAIAVRNGASEPVGPRKLSEVLKCSSCASIEWDRATAALKCTICGNELIITEEGTVLN